MAKTKIKKQHALVVVAHPDDETIWMGGFIFGNPEIDWTIISLCRSSDTDRAPKFKRVMKVLNARGIIEDLDDKNKLTINQTIPIIKKIILKNFANKKFDLLFTHGVNGEYGHNRHKGVHLAIKELIKNEKLSVKHVLCFDYIKAGKNELPLMKANNNAEVTFYLNNKEFEKKKKIVAEMYGYSNDGIDVNLCTNPEAFKIIN